LEKPKDLGNEDDNDDEDGLGLPLRMKRRMIIDDDL